MIDQIGLNWGTFTKLILVACFFIFNYIFIIRSNKEKINKIEKIIFPKDREGKIITLLDCKEMQINCHKIRVLELDNIFTKIDIIKEEVKSLKLDFKDLRDLILEAIKHI